MAARKRTWTPDVVRKRLRVSMLAKRLRDHALGQNEMTATQIKAAEILLRKAWPDLKAVEHSGEIGHTHQMTDAELDRRIAELSAKVGAAVITPGAPTTH